MDTLKPKDKSGIGIKAIVAALPYVNIKQPKNGRQPQQKAENTDAKKS